jgi:Superfamily II DNA/RNA helicases, SNF2 family
LSSFTTIRFHGPATERERLKNDLRGKQDFDILITTYESYVAEDTWFKSRRWTYCVLDEGHKIKNSEINLARKVQGIGSLFRLSSLFPCLDTIHKKLNR